MQVRRISAKMAAIGLVAAMGMAIGSPDADARTRNAAHGGASHARGESLGRSYAAHGGHFVRGRLLAHFASGGLQCVPFARENTGIELAGNAGTWWYGADGVYQRGARPEVGSVLNFRANGRMRMGHVAVVSNVVDGRNIEIDHANWAGPGANRGGISRNITVVDVSPNNDWTAVRVALGHTGEFGSVYPTFGFIYDRPDTGTMVANSGVSPAPVLNAAPHDLRPAAERVQVATAAGDNEEVAEASDEPQPRVRRAGYRGRVVNPSRSASHVASSTAGHNASRVASNGATHGTSRSTGRVAVTRVQAHGAPATHAHHNSRNRT